MMLDLIKILQKVNKTLSVSSVSSQSTYSYIYYYSELSVISWRGASGSGPSVALLLAKDPPPLDPRPSIHRPSPQTPRIHSPAPGPTPLHPNDHLFNAESPSPERTPHGSKITYKKFG